MATRQMTRSQTAATAIGLIMPTLFALLPAAAGQDICQQQRVEHNEPEPFLDFGQAVDVRNGRAIIGSQFDREIATNAGAAFIFAFDSGTNQWVLQQKLLASDGGSFQLFGRDVAVDGDHALVGRNGSQAYAFSRAEDGAWIESQILTPYDDMAPNAFGAVVEMSSTTGLFGAWTDSEAAQEAGAVYVYTHDGNTWTPQQKLMPSDAKPFFRFGQSIAISGNTLAVGAPGHTGGGTGLGGFGIGAVYLFEFNGEQWVETQIITPGLRTVSLFGISVAIDGDVLVVGNPSANAAYTTSVYQRDTEDGMWQLHQQIDRNYQSGNFGRSVAIEGDTIIVGAYNFDAGPSMTGAAFVYEPDNDGNWQERAMLTPEPNPWTNFFGRDVAIDSGIALIGANGEDQQSGAAYLFDLNPTPGDVNCDGIVNGDDLAHFLGEWGPCDICEHCPADVNDDCTVDGADLAILLGNWE